MERDWEKERENECMCVHVRVCMFVHAWLEAHVDRVSNFFFLPPVSQL